jgi:hypothetical protein
MRSLIHSLFVNASFEFPRELLEGCKLLKQFLGKAYHFLTLVRLNKKKELKNDRFSRGQGSYDPDDVF